MKRGWWTRNGCRSLVPISSCPSTIPTARKAASTPRGYCGPRQIARERRKVEARCLAGLDRVCPRSSHIGTSGAFERRAASYTANVYGVFRDHALKGDPYKIISLNIAYNFRPQLIGRLSYAKSIARPNL